MLHGVTTRKQNKKKKKTNEQKKKNKVNTQTNLSVRLFCQFVQKHHNQHHIQNIFYHFQVLMDPSYEGMVILIHLSHYHAWTHLNICQSYYSHFHFHFHSHSFYFYSHSFYEICWCCRRIFCW